MSLKILYRHPQRPDEAGVGFRPGRGEGRRDERPAGKSGLSGRQDRDHALCQRPCPTTLIDQARLRPAQNRPPCYTAPNERQRHRGKIDDLNAMVEGASPELKGDINELRDEMVTKTDRTS